MIEVEQKYRDIDVASVTAKLKSLGADQPRSTERHTDTYYNHPSRDFAETKEAFRVRRIDDQSWMTYKGAKLPGVIKARREIELPIGSGEADAVEFEAALELLSFRRVATVSKSRQSFQIPLDAGSDSICVTIDVVDELGEFVEIEVVASSEDDVDAARRRIEETAQSLGLDHAEPRSYLSMLLEKR